MQTRCRRPIRRTTLKKRFAAHAWMFAIGAMDAYFCDAYTDIVAASIISKNRHPAMVLPDFFYKIKFPIRTIVEWYSNENWRWRSPGRMMDNENVLSIQTVKEFFNKFFHRPSLFQGSAHSAMDCSRRCDETTIRDNEHRLRGFAADSDRRAASEIARDWLDNRLEKIIQRRHDCIHNCDRSRVSPQALKLAGTVAKVIEDVEFLVKRCNEHINSEFREFLVRCGCPVAVIAQCGY